MSTLSPHRGKDKINIYINMAYILYYIMFPLQQACFESVQVYSKKVFPKSL
jgi:hypothetical protein